MKKLILSLLAALTLTSCVVYADGPVNSGYSSGCTTFCDDYGCREVCGTYYYTSAGEIVYWDAHFGCWIGPHGYWYHGAYYHGFHPGYHTWYHSGFYHSYHGGGYHGGHGGHRR